MTLQSWKSDDAGQHGAVVRAALLWVHDFPVMEIAFVTVQDNAMSIASMGA
jgi:hypothetical protein